MVRAIGLRPHFVGPRERMDVPEALRSGPRLFVQPGGDELDDAWAFVGPVADSVRGFVDGGGAYLGLCLGGYLAGASPGYGLVPGDTDQYSARPGALLHGSASAVLPVNWRGTRRMLYAQDPPVFEVAEGTRGMEILARYADGSVAALVVPFGRGRVGVVGPHPEATDDWFVDEGLRPVEPSGLDLGVDLLHTLLGGPG